jgi:hypothetical protein
MDPTPANGTIMDAIVGVPIDTLSIKAGDPNRDEVSIKQLPELPGAALESGPWGTPQLEAVTCTAARPIAGDLSVASGAVANVSYTPQCSQAPSSYPSDQPLVPLCFVAQDRTRLINSLDFRTTNSAPRCVLMRVRSASNPVITSPYYFDRLGSPNPNPGTSGIREMRAQIGCTLRIPVTAEERGVNGTDDSLLQVRSFRTTVSSMYEQRTLRTPLPEGGRMVTTTPSRINTGTLEWVPRRGQEGYVVSAWLCVVLSRVCVYVCESVCV